MVPALLAVAARARATRVLPVPASPQPIAPLAKVEGETLYFGGTCLLQKQQLIKNNNLITSSINHNNNNDDRCQPGLGACGASLGSSGTLVLSDLLAHQRTCSEFLVPADIWQRSWPYSRSHQEPKLCGQRTIKGPVREHWKVHQHADAEVCVNSGRVHVMLKAKGQCCVVHTQKGKCVQLCIHREGFDRKDVCTSVYAEKGLTGKMCAVGEYRAPLRVQRSLYRSVGWSTGVLPCLVAHRTALLLVATDESAQTAQGTPEAGTPSPSGP